jgi:hypothetical protein
MMEISTYLLCRFDTEKRADVTTTIFKYAIDTPEFIESTSCFVTIFHTEAALDEVHTELKLLVQPSPICYFLIEISDIDNITMNWPPDVYNRIAKYIGLDVCKPAKPLHLMSYPELKKTLAQHLANENYELAAIVRDELKTERFAIFQGSDEV